MQEKQIVPAPMATATAVIRIAFTFIPIAPVVNATAMALKPIALGFIRMALALIAIATAANATALALDAIALALNATAFIVIPIAFVVIQVVFLKKMTCGIYKKHISIFFNKILRILFFAVIFYLINFVSVAL